MIPMGKDKMRELFGFNAKLALKLVVAATDEYMRVRGWEQVDVLITVSKRDRWTPTAYRVRRASNRTVTFVGGSEDNQGLRANTLFSLGIVVRARYWQQP